MNDPSYDVPESVLKSLAKLTEIERLVEALGGRAPDFYTLRQSVLASYGFLAPFKNGDRVVLVDAPDINEKDAPGWMGSSHFLINGAHGVVVDRGINQEVFWIGVEFDDETSVVHEGPDKGKLIKPDKKHTYAMSYKRFVLESEYVVDKYGLSKVIEATNKLGETAEQVREANKLGLTLSKDYDTIQAGGNK